MELEHSNSDIKAYYQLQERQRRKWEDLCRCCGACCGILEGDPCEHLIDADGGKYACEIYETRFGLHKTRNGKPFKCVPIRDILYKTWPGNQNCAYKQNSACFRADPV